MNPLRKIPFILPWLFRLALFGAIPYSFYVKDFLFAFGAIAAVILSSLPAYWERNLKAHLPLGLDLFVVIAFFMHIVLGEILRFYDLHYFFDKVMHFYGTAIIAILAFLTVFTLHWSRKLVLSLPLIAYFTIIFSMAIGSFWEIGEFTIDKLFGRNTQYSLDNTMWDLIFDFLGGLAAALFGVIYTYKKNQQQISELILPLQKILGIKRIPQAPSEPRG